MLQNFIYLSILISLLSIAGGFFSYFYILKIDKGNEKLKEIASIIRNGSLKFLQREYIYISPFVLLTAIFLSYFVDYRLSIAFLLGVFFALIITFIAAFISTSVNFRSANSAIKIDKERSLLVAYLGGATMGLILSGFALLGVVVVYLIFFSRGDIENVQYFSGFAFGATLISFFTRVGGGVFTKSADVGADLVGKLENKMKEDDSNNPAVIADLVGDNVGDFVGMNSDFFGSYVESIIATIIIGSTGIIFAQFKIEAVTLPIVLMLLGIISSFAGIISVYFLRKLKRMIYLNYSSIVSFIIFLPTSYFIINNYFQDIDKPINLLIALAAGIILNIVLGGLTSYLVSKKPILSIVKASENGSVSNIIAGLSLGMYSTVFLIALIGVLIFLAYHFAGFYGIGLMAIGMLANSGISMAGNLFGPIVDNAGGLVKLSGSSKKAEDITERLDFIGNTNSTIGKSISIASSAVMEPCGA